MKEGRIVTELYAAASLAARNTKLFFRDKWAVIFTFMGPLIIVFIYLGFLRGLQIDSVMGSLPVGFSLERSVAGGFVDLWMLASVLGVACMTSALNSLSYIVYDKENGVLKDFMVSPVKPRVITMGYLFSALLTTFMVVGVLFVFCMVYIAANGIFYMTAGEFFALLGLLVLSCVSALVVLMPIVSLFKTGSASGAFNGIFSGIIGFLAGAYMPISAFGKGIQYVSALIPGSHSAGLFRSIMLNGALPVITEGMPAEVAKAVQQGLMNGFSLELNFFGVTADATFMWIYLAGSVVVFLTLNLILERIKKRKMYL